jgi:hypothetical protein
MMAVRDEDTGEGPIRLRTYYTCAILAPLAVLATVAAAGGDSGSLTLGVGPGGTVRWLYPRSAVRDLLAASLREEPPAGLPWAPRRTYIPTLHKPTSPPASSNRTSSPPAPTSELAAPPDWPVSRNGLPPTGGGGLG